MPNYQASLSEKVSQNKKKGHFKTQTIFLGFFGLIVIILAAILVYFAIQYTNVKNNPQLITQQENLQLKNKVAELINVPVDEEPTVATVLDSEQLKSQDFFKKAVNGDKLLVFVRAGKAILYRPSTHKIIEVAPITINKDGSTNAPSVSTSTPSVNQTVAPTTSTTTNNTSATSTNQ